MSQKKEDVIKETAKARMKGKAITLTLVCFICDIGFIISAALTAALGGANVLKRTELYLTLPITAVMSAAAVAIRILTRNYKRKKFTEAYIMSKHKTEEKKLGKTEIKYLMLSAMKGLYKLFLPAIAVLGVINICYKIKNDSVSGIAAFFETLIIAAIIEFLNSYFYMKVIAVKTKTEEKETEEGVNEI